MDEGKACCSGACALKYRPPVEPVRHLYRVIFEDPDEGETHSERVGTLEEVQTWAQENTIPGVSFTMHKIRRAG